MNVAASWFDRLDIVPADEALEIWRNYLRAYYRWIDALRLEELEAGNLEEASR